MVNYIKNIYNFDDNWKLFPVEEHDGGRNIVYVCEEKDEPKYVIRISMTGDREEIEYLAETEFVNYLVQGGASVSGVIPSVNGKLVEKYFYSGKEVFISCFRYAKGILISDNGYKYISGRPLSEYFFITGKTLGKIHSLSKLYRTSQRRKDYFDKYNMAYINELMADEYAELKLAIARRLEIYQTLTRNTDEYGLVHFDYSDGNYHIDMETGDITVFDFDNCMYCWYMFDLANLWTHGVGWYQFEMDSEKRKLGMQEYFRAIVEGYRIETELSDDMLEKLPLFIDMVLIENIVDEFECCKREGKELDYEDINAAAECLINDIPFAGFI